MFGGVLFCAENVSFFYTVPLHTINSHTFPPTFHASKFLQ